MAAEEYFTIKVRYGCKEPKEVRINNRWTVVAAKEHLYRELEIESEVDIIYGGKIVTDNMTVEELGLSDFTTLDLTKTQGLKSNLPTFEIADRRKSFVGESAEALIPTPKEVDQASRQCFYVYCRRECKAVQEAKLRVRCKTCGLTQLVVHKDPETWEDLEPDKIEGECRGNNCPGKIAEFFFKCAGHVAKEGESFPPLKRVVTNTRKTPCIICFEDEMATLYVFECPDRHTICLGCLEEHCRRNIQNRAFVQTEKHGYTLPCPCPADACKKSYITDPHTFKIVGNEVYQKYQNYGTQECVLKQGGVLCPGVNCAEPFLPDEGMRRIKCPACQYVFCRRCKENYHEGDCEVHAREEAAREANDPNISTERAEKARLKLETYAVMDKECKQCPGCNSKIYKSSGCNHMTCSHCKFEFCWLCLVAWSTGCKDKHWFRAEP